MNGLGAGLRVLLGAGALALLTCATAADQPPEAPANDAMILKQILAARATGFASLKGVQAPANPDRSASWDAKLAPFGLTCRIFQGSDGTAYWCTNAAAQVAAQSASGATPIDLPKTGLADIGAHTLVQYISTAFRVAAPDLNVYPGFSGGAEDEETLVGASKNEFTAAIHLVSLARDGDTDTANVSFVVYAKPLDYDPARD